MAELYVEAQKKVKLTEIFQNGYRCLGGGGMGEMGRDWLNDTNLQL